MPDRWDTAVGRAEAIAGISMAAIREFPGTAYASFLSRLQGSRAARLRRALAGFDMTLLTSRGWPARLYVRNGFAELAPFTGGRVANLWYEKALS